MKFTPIIFFMCLLLPVTGGAQPASIERGAYLARAGDCMYCHSASKTAPNHEPYAGGLPINSPFGVIYSTNISPDPEYGIGQYTLHDFERALRQGIAKDGHHLYPAMPYPSFAGVTEADIEALYNYFMHEVKPVHAEPPKTKLIFPFNQRWGLWFWDVVFAPGKHYKPDDNKDASWNRGAYLVESLGHCSACHTPRGPVYEERGGPKSHLFLTGGLLDNWYAANLTATKASGLGNWSEEEIGEFLKTGHSAQSMAFGNMKDVVENSTQYMSAEDIQAISHYLKSLPVQSGRSAYDGSAAKKPQEFELPGAGIYASYCARCHQPDGTGNPRLAPKLAGSSIVLSENATSLVRIVLEGGKTAQLQTGNTPLVMPSFAKLTDGEIADVVSYIRGSWGNVATPIATRDVGSLRDTLNKQEK